MRCERWTPVKGETWKPSKVTEPTLWEMIFTDPDLTEGSLDCLNMCRIHFNVLDGEPHHYRAVFTRGLVPDAMFVWLRETPSVRLAVGPIHTQAEADTWIPQLLATKAVVKEVILDPQEAIDLTRYLPHVRVLRVGEDA